MPRAKTTSTKDSKKTKSTKVASTAKRNSFAIDVFDTKGKVVETLQLPKEIFDSKVNTKLIAQAVRVYLANQRRGTVSTKTRGEVRGSTRKIYRQKGTGRARHGGIRAPIFVHGGLAFGPKPRDYSLKMPQKARRAALFSALTSKLKNQEVRVVSGLEKLEPKTKDMVEVLTKLELNGKKKNILLIVSGVDRQNIARAARNIEGIVFTPANLLNTYDVLEHKMLLFMKEAIPVLQETFLKGSK